MVEAVRVFVSYAHKDKNSQEIKRDLLEYSKLRGIDLIIDTDVMEHGNSIESFIDDELVKGGHIILVFSKAYFNSHYCMRELLGIWRRGREIYRDRTHPILTEDSKLIDLNDLKEVWKYHNDKDRLHQDFPREIDELIAFENQRNKIELSKLKLQHYAPLFDRIVEIPEWLSEIHKRCDKWILTKKNEFLLENSEIIKLYQELRNSSLLLQNEIVKKFLDASTNRIKRIEFLKKSFLFGVLIFFLFFLAWQYREAADRTQKDIQKRLSLGEKYFLEASFDKRIGAREFPFKPGDAITGFSKSLDEVPDDPETRIYLENVKAKANALADSGDQNQIRTIAVSVPIQKNVTVAKEILRGVAQAQLDVNERWRKKCNTSSERAEDCSDSWLLQVLIASDDNDIEIAEGIAKHIANERKDILAVIGHNSSQVSNAVLKEYQNKLVMISPTSYTLNHSAKEIKYSENNYIFSITYPVESVLPAIVDHIKSKASNQQKRNVYFCADPIAHDTDKLVEGLDQEIKSKDLKKYIVVEGITKENNKTVIECDISNLKSDKLSKEKLDKRKEKLTDLFLSVHVKNIIDGAIIARRNSNNNSLDLYNAYTLFSRDVLGEDLEGAIVAVNWHSKSSHDDNDSKKKSKEFIKNANCIWNGQKIKVNEDCPIGKFDPDIDLTWRSAMAYDATQLIIQGLSSVPLESKEDKARQELQQKVSEKVSKLEFTGVTGKVVFDQKTGSRDYDRINGKGHLVQVLARCDGKYQFVPIEKQNDSSYKLVFPEGVKFKDKTKSPKEQCA